MVLPHTLLLPTASEGADYLFDDEFPLDAVAPLASPRFGTPGKMTLIQTDGQLSVSGGKLVFPAQATPFTGDQGFYIEQTGGGGFARQSGRVALFKVNFGASPAPSFPAVGLNRAATCIATSMDAEVYFTSGLFAFGTSNTASPGGLLAFATGTDYYVLLWELTQGMRALVRGGAYTDWTLLFDTTQGNNATLYPAFDNYQSAGTMEFVRGLDLPVAYQTDYANIPGLVRVTSSSQSLGSDLVVNGNMETGSPPSSWTPNASASVSAAADERTGGSGTQSLQLIRVSSGSNYVQNSATVTQHKIYQGSCWLKNVDASVGVGVFSNGDTAGFYGGTGGSGYYSGTAWIKTKRLWRNTTAGVNIRIWINTGADGQSGKADDIEVKEVTVNTPITMPADAQTRTLFPLPASPVAGERICLISRLNAVGEEFYNCFSLEYIRNNANSDWDLVFCRYSTGTRTIISTTTGVGAKSGLSLIQRGNTHQVFARNNSTGVWNQAGSGFTDANFNTATLCNVIATDGFTSISELAAIPYNTGWPTPLAGVQL